MGLKLNQCKGACQLFMEGITKTQKIARLQATMPSVTADKAYQL
jgi:hypothetical protein